MDSLKDKIDQIKDTHAAEVVEKIQSDHDERSRQETVFFLGRVKQNDHLAQAIATNLSAQTLRALEYFQEEKKYLSLGYTTFVDFLEKSEYSPMSKHQYYERVKLLNAHGDEVYDLLTSVGISVRAQRLLGKGELSIKDDKLIVGDQEVDISNSGVIKDVLREFVDDIRDREKQIASQQNKIESLNQQIDRGQAEFDELQRSLDAMRDGDPHDRSVADAVLSLLTLCESAGQLDERRRAEVGGRSLRTIWDAFRQLRSVYGVNVSLEDDNQPIQSSGVSDLAARVLAEDDDFGDEDEV